MSKPREIWWSYVKAMIRRYPELCAREAELHRQSLSQSITGMPHGSGKTSDPVADAALRELPAIQKRETDAVRKAVEQTRLLDTGEERISMIRLVFWKKTHTLEGAAQKCHISYITAKRWHSEFIMEVAKNFGLLEI